jgi:hypothetical protein
MDFEDLNDKEDVVKLDSQARAAVFDLNKQARILEQQYGIKVLGNLSPVQKSTSQLDYDGRLYTLLSIIDEPILSNRYDALKHAYTLRHGDLPYNPKLTSLRLSGKHITILNERCVSRGIKPPKKPSYSKDYIDVIKAAYMLNRVQELERENVKLKQLLYDNTSIWYRGVEIKRLTRRYKCTIDGVDLTTGLSTFEKLDEYLIKIDKLLE